MFAGYKNRQSLAKSPSGTLITYVHGTSQVRSSVPMSSYSLTGAEWMYTQSNPISRLGHNPDDFDLGSDWQCNQKYAEFRPGYSDSSVRRFDGGVNDYAVQGLLAPECDNSLWPGITTLSQNDMYAYGTKGFNLTVPNRPVASASQFLYELHDLPKAPFAEAVKDKARYFRNLARHAGDEYLNVEFGWKPFVSDVHKAIHGMASAQKWYHQFLKDSGKVVRRRVSLGETQQAPVVTTIGGASRSWQIYVYTQNAGTQWVTNESLKVWFSAAYKYWIPQAHGKWAERFQEGYNIANHLGLSIDPQTLWSIAPWEWMTDWFGNIGGVLANVSAFNKNNLVALHAYVMAEQHRTRTVTSYGTNPDTKKTAQTSVILHQSFKQRWRGNPYGFATNPTFTSAQAAILAALGLSRIPHRP